MKAVFADVAHYGQSVSWFFANQTICHVSKRDAFLKQLFMYTCIFIDFKMLKLSRRRCRKAPSPGTVQHRQTLVTCLTEEGEVDEIILNENIS